MSKIKEINGIIYKECSKCHTMLPATLDYFYYKKGCKFDLLPTCKECDKKKAKEYVESNEELVSKRRKKFREENKEKVAIQKRNSYLKNKSHYKKYREQWNSENKELKQSINKKYYNKNKELILQKNKNYRLTHKEQIKETMHSNYLKNKEKIMIRIKKWNSKNIEKVRLYHRIKNHKRRSKFRNLPNTLNKKDWNECKSYFNNKCAYCGKELKRLEQEHVIPLNKNGSYTKQNIVTACRSCNSSKSNKNMEEWYKRQPFYSEQRLNKIYKWIGVKENIQQLSIL